MEKYKCLSGAVLKNIALITMVIDHFNKAIVAPHMGYNMPAYMKFIIGIFDIVGRFAFPIFAFLLVEGFFHTKSKFKYLRNLIVFAFISEIPYNLYFDLTLRSPYAQNIYFSLAIAFGIIWAIDESKKRVKKWPLAAIILVLLGFVLSAYLCVDFVGVIVPVILYLFRQNEVMASIAGFLPLIKTPWSLVGFFLTHLYNGKRGKQVKWLNYWIYPIHLLIFGLIRYYTL